MQRNDCDVCAINETALNGSEYVEVFLPCMKSHTFGLICV